MKTWNKAVVAVGTVLALCSSAVGGAKYTIPVDVNLSAGYARGNMGDARNSADTTQYIGCYNSAAAGSTVVACEAMTAAGTYKSCATSDANMVAAARSIGVGSYVFFRWDASGACTTVHVTNYSWVRPSAP